MNTWTIGSTRSEQVFNYLLEKSSAEGTYICFDYFDTLVTRSIYPEYTKQLASKLLSLACRGTDPEELYRLRSDLERTMCEERAASGGELEFYLHEFGPHYLKILSDKKPDTFFGWNDERFTRLILDIELNVEKNVQEPQTDVVNVLRQLKRAEVKTVLISDFYLPSSHFLPMLDHHGFTELLDHVYISADHTLAKGSGRLYEKVCNDLGCSPDQLVMVGDNEHSDIEMAKQLGIKAIHVQNPKQQKYYQSWAPEKQNVDSYFAECIAKIDGSPPFKEMAHSLYFFIYRLFEHLVEVGVKQVFFFSKEGEFLKRLFDRFQTDLFGSHIITSHYLLASRKATFMASLRPLAEEDFARLFNYYRDISCRDFLLSLNLEESLAEEICNKADLDFDSRLEDFPNRSDFERLRQSSLFQTVYEQRRAQQKENFIQYLESFGYDFRHHGVTIVDVGWKGSIQDNVYHILEGRTDVNGYFVGSLIASEKKKNNRKKGLLFDDTPTPTPFFHVYNNNRSLYEMILGASHGSADGYYTKEQFDGLGEDHQKVVGRKIAGQNGTIYVATLDLPEERQLFEQVIRPLQEKLFRGFVAQIQAYLKSDCTHPESVWFAQQHARMVFTPKTEEVDFFERLYHLENFGVFEYTDFQSSNKLPIQTRINNLMHVIKSKTVLESGIWPPIILRRLGVGFYRHIDGYRRYRRVFKQAE